MQTNISVLTRTRCADLGRDPERKARFLMLHMFWIIASLSLMRKRPALLATSILLTIIPLARGQQVAITTVPGQAINISLIEKHGGIVKQYIAKLRGRLLLDANGRVTGLNGTVRSIETADKKSMSIIKTEVRDGSLLMTTRGGAVYAMYNMSSELAGSIRLVKAAPSAGTAQLTPSSSTATGAKILEPNASTSARITAMVPLTFTPPAPEGNKDEFLSAIQSVGDEYKAYEVSDARDKIQVRDLSVAVVNTLKTFEGVEFIAAGAGDPSGVVGHMAMVTKPLDESTRSQVYSTVLKSTTAYLNKKCRVSDQAAVKLMVILYGGTSMYFDSNQTPWGEMDIRLFLLDTKQQRVIWYSDKAWGLGRDAIHAADFAATSIASQLDKLFSVVSPDQGASH